MRERKYSSSINAQQEVNLKGFLQKVYKNKLLFIISVVLLVALAIVYIKTTTPIYEVSTSILIDSSGENRVLGKNKYVEGGVNLIEMEKNLYNEIGIIKSFSLVRQTVEDLGLDVSYYTGNWFMKKEHYGYFPVDVVLLKDKPQLYGVPFRVELVSDTTYRLSIEATEFTVSNPVNGSFHVIDKDFEYSQEFSFGEMVEHDYFNFIVKKPDYKVSTDDFVDANLSFTVNILDNVANNYISNIEVNNIDIQASILRILSSGAIVGKEVDFLKKLMENYIQNNLISRNKIASGKEAFIREQLGAVSDSLLRVESSLEVFKRNEKAVNLGATANNALAQTQDLQVQRAKIEMDINYYNSLIKFIEQNQGSEDLVIPTAIGIDDDLLNQNILELKGLYAEKSRKKFFITDDNQEMGILNAQIAESTQLLLNNLRNAINSSRFAMQGINSQLASYGGVIGALPTREKQLLDIERKSALYGNLYNYLSQELAKAGIARAESTSDTRVLDEARMVGIGPVSPKKGFILALALILGLLIPVGWLVLFSSNDTIEGVNQILENTVIPLIATISHHDSKAKKSKLKLSRWKLKESFRDLCSKLQLIEQAHNVLGVTSIMPEEGKTFCAINLAIALAEAGKKVLLVDTDIRNPSLVKHLNKVEGKGLSNFLNGDVANAKEIVYQHETLPNLKFIPTSVINGNVYGLLSGERMKSLIGVLKKEYDYVILDTPAVGLVSDYLLFWEVIDINLFVVRREKSKLSFLDDFENLLPDGNKKKSFIILNDASGKDYKYGYGQKYGKNTEQILVNDSLAV